MLLPGKTAEEEGKTPAPKGAGTGEERRPAGAAAKPPERAEGPFHRREAAMPCGADPDFAETGVTASPGAAAPGEAGRSAGRPAGS